MKGKSDALTRLVQRTTGHADVVRPMVRPMFSPVPVPAGEIEKDVTGYGLQVVGNFPRNMRKNAEDVGTTEKGDRQETASAREDDANVEANLVSPRAQFNHQLSISNDQLSTKKGIGDRPEITRVGAGLVPAREESASVEANLVSPRAQFSDQWSNIDDQSSTKKGIGDRPEIKRVGAGLVPAREESANVEADLVSPRAQFNRQLSMINDQLLMVKGNGDIPERTRVGAGLASARKKDANVGAGLVPARAFARARETETPVVRVSIGRIDVRAVLQQPQVQQPVPMPEPVKPTLSLEEYLRRRDGGER